MIKLKECKPYLREYYLIPNQVPAYQSTDIIMALEYADRFARSFFRPIVVCLALGTSYGSHSGSSPLSNYINRLADKRSRVFVIGGGVSKAGEILTENLKKHYNQNLIDALCNKEFRLATLGNDAGIYGSAKMILDYVTKMK